jgi:hypothetical protein
MVIVMVYNILNVPLNVFPSILLKSLHPCSSKTLIYRFLFFWSLSVFGISVILSLQILEMFPPPFWNFKKYWHYSLDISQSFPLSPYGSWVFFVGIFSYWFTLFVMSLFTIFFLIDSVWIGCLCLGVSPSLLDYPICWCISVHNSTCQLHRLKT